MVMSLNRAWQVTLMLGLMVWPSCSSNQETEEQLVKITTRFGDIKIILYDDTPKHKESFLELAKEGAYDSTAFYRVIKDFMVQGGDVAINADFEKEARRLIPSEISPRIFPFFILNGSPSVG